MSRPATPTSYDDEWPESDDYFPSDDELFDQPPASPPPAAASTPGATATASTASPPATSTPSVSPAASAAPPVAPAPASPAGDEPTRSKWDGMGVGGGTVRAHWETDEDDAAEATRVVVSAPPPPPPPPIRAGSNGRAPAPSTTPAAPVEPSEPDALVLDFDDLRRRWPSLREQIWPNAMERVPFISAELVGVEGACLVVQASAGGLLMLNDDRRRTIRGNVIQAIGKGADIRFIDDKTPYTPPIATASASAAPAAPAAPALPTNDPLIQAGLRYFGGPLERLSDP